MPAEGCPESLEIGRPRPLMWQFLRARTPRRQQFAPRREAPAPVVDEAVQAAVKEGGGVLLLFGVLVTGLRSSVIAMRAAVRGPTLEALRSE